MTPEEIRKNFVKAGALGAKIIVSVIYRHENGSIPMQEYMPLSPGYYLCPGYKLELPQGVQIVTAVSTQFVRVPE